jgi:F-type H+-transporting ATPase subunit gamma
MRNIKQRISNISSVEQIIKAMDMVASTKLMKARTRLEGVRPIYQGLKRMVEEAGYDDDAKKHPFYEEREVKNSLYIILTSDSGLSGGYNINISAKALEHMNQGKNEKILVVGAKGKEYFKKKGKNIIHTIIDMEDAQIYFNAEKLAKWIMESYLSGETDEVFIAYTRFDTVLSYVPIVEKLLPAGQEVTEDESRIDKKYEPDINTFIDHIIPLYLHMNLFRAFSEADTSEQAARMVNMDAAGKNASEMIDDLTLMYNRKRQADITQELSEIVGSANILNKGGPHDS